MDRITPERRSANMAKIKSKGMKPEMLVRRLTHRLGYRFRLHCADLPGKPDMVFTRRKKVVFVHGCFWHRHESDTCKRSHAPRSNSEYWLAKLDRNVERDIAVRNALAALGWDILVLWECELKDQVHLEYRLRTFLG